MTQAKSTAPKPLVSVYAEKGVLAFRFSSKFNPLFEILDSKAPSKQKTMGLGLRESPDNWKLAQSAALRIERDLSDSENWQLLFDPTFVKYGLAVKYTSAALKLAAPIPEPEPEMTVGAMWEDYLIWKQPQLQPTTFNERYLSTFTNIVKGLTWDRVNHVFVENGCSVYKLFLGENVANKILSQDVFAANKSSTLSALSEAFTRLQSLGKTKVKINPFIAIGGVVENKTDMYKQTITAAGEVLRWWDTEDTETNPDEKDRRAFTKDERDIIIKAFYESDKASCRQAAPLIEFLFLTGCRPGEAFALEWKDVFMGREKDYIRFSKSYNGKQKNTQITKTGEIRLFKIYQNLNDLLLRIKPADIKPTDLIFRNTEGNCYNSSNLGKLWLESSVTRKKGNEPYKYSGVVTQLVSNGLISRYLSPYHTRHTFITLMAHAGTDLLLLATACGNSVDVIQRHYLGVNEKASFPNI